jgi:hypothetical protein
MWKCHTNNQAGYNKNGGRYNIGHPEIFISEQKERKSRENERGDGYEHGCC